MGLDALEMVRIEAGFIMPGFDFNTAEATVRNDYDRSPYEVGLGWVVDLAKGHFCGRKALQKERERTPRRRLTKLVVDGNKPAENSFIFDRRNRTVGTVTSASFSVSQRSRS